jgi:hypothetical protein
MMFHRFWIASVLLGSLALTGCGDSKKDEVKIDEEPATEIAVPKNKTLPICPQVAIMRELELVRDYGGEKPADDQLVASAYMKKVVGTCSYKDNGVDISFELQMQSGRGPRLGGLHTSFPYFIAVIDPNETILNKELMTTEFSFASDKQDTTHSEDLHIFLPLKITERDKAPDYRVLIGFQLTDAQLAEASANNK